MQLIPAAENEIREQLKALYVRAFPACERKPYEVMEKKRQEGGVDILAFEQDGIFCGMAVSIRYRDIILLDYFAIEDSVRGQGYGSQALGLLCEYYRGKRFMLEVESTYEDAPNKMQRIARKTFYLKNGCRELGILVFIYETEMELLGYQTGISFEEYEALYQEHYPERLPLRLSVTASR